MSGGLCSKELEENRKMYAGLEWKGQHHTNFKLLTTFYSQIKPNDLHKTKRVGAKIREYRSTLVPSLPAALPGHGTWTFRLCSFHMEIWWKIFLLSPLFASWENTRENKWESW